MEREKAIFGMRHFEVQLLVIGYRAGSVVPICAQRALKKLVLAFLETIFEIFLRLESLKKIAFFFQNFAKNFRPKSLRKIALFEILILPVYPLRGAKMRFCGLSSENICCAKMAIGHTSDSVWEAVSDVCQIAIFAQHMLSDGRPQNRIFAKIFKNGPKFGPPKSGKNVLKKCEERCLSCF